MDGKVPVVGRQLPTAILFAFEGDLIREELPGDLSFRLARRCIGGSANDDNALVLAGVFAGVEAWGVDRKLLDVTELFLSFKDGDLIFLEESPPFVLVTIFGSVNPFFDDGFG